MWRAVLREEEKLDDLEVRRCYGALSIPIFMACIKCTSVSRSALVNPFNWNLLQKKSTLSNYKIKMVALGNINLSSAVFFISSFAVDNQKMQLCNLFSSLLFFYVHTQLFWLLQGREWVKRKALKIHQSCIEYFFQKANILDLCLNLFAHNFMHDWAIQKSGKKVRSWSQ